MGAQFEHLFRPIDIGPMHVPNRICWSAHSSNMAAEGLPTPRMARYIAERARGGAGWLVVGGTVIDEATSSYEPSMNVISERAIPGYQELVQLVHEHGARITTQMDHWGPVLPYPRQARGPLLAPSAIADIGAQEVPKAMQEEDMEVVLDAWERSAAIVRESGFDGAEVLCSMGFSLLQQFLSPRLNKRIDKYGGSLENRLRFPLRVLERVRAALGPELCLGIKLTGDELVEGGLDQQQAQEIAVRIADSGFVDYLHICLGSPNDESPWLPEMSYPPGFATYLAAGVRERVDLPIVAVKRINDPVQAEKILADGHADVIGMTRALIADPELPQKARTGRLQEIRHCTASNQECNWRSVAKLPIGCIHNPAVGHESSWGIGTILPAVHKKDVLVVGGGPGGLKSAELATERGHRVRLFEASDSLGGQINWMSRVNSRKDFEVVVRHLVFQVVERLGVEVIFGERITPDRILEEGADAVVVATGALPLKTGYSTARPDVERMPGVDQDNVITVFDVFEHLERVGEKVVVVDQFADAEGSMVAEYLADHGRAVEVVTGHPYVGRNTEEYGQGLLMGRLVERGVRMSPSTSVDSISGNLINGANTITNEMWCREADTIVLLMGKRANEDLYLELRGQVDELHRVGDCVAPRRITDAIFEGNAVGREL